MKKNYLPFITLCVLSVTFFLGGCGGGPGSPGSSGSQDTGINPRVTAITHSDPAGDQGDIWEIDLIGNICTGGTLEKFGDDFAHITFHGDQLNPNVTSHNVLNVTNYTVTFFKENPSLPTIDSISAGSQSGISILPGADTGPFSFLVFDTGRKSKMVTDLNTINNPPSAPFLYNMEIVLYGQDDFGNNFIVGPIIRLITINDFNKC